MQRPRSVGGYMRSPSGPPPGEHYCCWLIEAGSRRSTGSRRSARTMSCCTRLDLDRWHRLWLHCSVPQNTNAQTFLAFQQIYAQDSGLQWSKREEIQGGILIQILISP
jgi:hypothetical protein